MKPFCNDCLKESTDLELFEYIDYSNCPEYEPEMLQLCHGCFAARCRALPKGKPCKA
jgi:hypothetical protein